MSPKLTKTLWMVLTAVAVGFTAYVVGRNLLHIWQTGRSLRAMRHEAEEYRRQIEADSTLIEHLRYDDYLEEYARERFNMQRRDEKVYRIR